MHFVFFLFFFYMHGWIMWLCCPQREQGELQENYMLFSIFNGYQTQHLCRNTLMLAECSSVYRTYWDPQRKCTLYYLFCILIYSVKQACKKFHELIQIKYSTCSWLNEQWFSCITNIDRFIVNRSWKCSENTATCFIIAVFIKPSKNMFCTACPFQHGRRLREKICLWKTTPPNTAILRVL